MQNVTIVRRMSRTLGRNVIVARASKGMTVSEFSRVSGVSRRTIDRVEGGIAIPYNPSMNTLSLLANALDTSVDHLLGNVA